MMRALFLLAVHRLAEAIAGFADDRHLTTDPACTYYRAPRPGSHLDRISRGVSCVRCMAHRAFYGDWDVDRNTVDSEVTP